MQLEISDFKLTICTFRIYLRRRRRSR